MCDMDARSPLIHRKLVVLDCSEVGLAEQCHRLTGSTTVPQVFFNRRYVGDASTLFDLVREEGEPLRQELAQLAMEPTNLAFPPPVDAAMIKVTADIAFSSQPTRAQLRGLAPFGFRYASLLCDALAPIYTSPLLGPDPAWAWVKAAYAPRTIPVLRPIADLS